MLPPRFFHFLKPIPMAKKLAAAEPTEEVVWLHSKDLGTRPFTPDHAEALLALQERKGYDHWQRAEAPADSTTA